MANYRIKELRQQARLTQAALAEKCGWEQARISHYETGRSEPRYQELKTIAAALGVSLQQLLPLESGAMIQKHDTPLMLAEQVSIYKGQNPAAVPLISWEQAAKWPHYQPQNTDKRETIICPADHGPKTYALRVRGEAMRSPYGPSYPEGCIIYIDPDKTSTVTNGDRVIARLQADGSATFKAYIEDSGQRFLKPLNPSYPVISEPFTIIGKLIGTWIAE